MKGKYVISWIFAAIFIVASVNFIGCEGGESGTLTGRVVDGFGYPLGGPAVVITLSGNPAFTNPDRWGNFIVHAPVGSYTMTISFSNPAAGFNYRVQEQVEIIHGTKHLGTFTLLNYQNMAGWRAYRNRNWDEALAYFSEQAALARSGQMVFLPYMRYLEGEPDENTILLQGVLSAENGLGWTYSRGYHDLARGKEHFQLGLSGGFNNLDAKVGLASIALGEGEAQTALDYLNAVIDEPGYYDSSQIHDNISEVDLLAARSLAEFLVGEVGASAETSREIYDRITEEGNSSSMELLNMLEEFRPGGKPSKVGF